MTKIITTLQVLRVPEEFEGDRSIDRGKPEQTNPSQQDTAENTRLEVQNHHLENNKQALRWNMHLF